MKLTALVIVVLIAGVLVLAATRPDTFTVARHATIKAPPDKVFSYISDFKRWDAWSPWERKDPAMKRTFGSVTAGKGATYAWEGNKEVGQGQMEIAESSAPSKVGIKLDFVKPFEAHNIVEFTLKPEPGGATHVTWSMQGHTPYFFKIVHLFIDMDRMVGGDFEAGLANLKAVAEK
ncbi:MAG: SRPBCC family protein [Betaproteobacteria bacterium]